jgi:hypothetical protein
MTQKAEILLEGSYLYYQKEKIYSQEEFKLVHLPENQSYHFYAEIISKVEEGESLKVLVRYEMNQHFMPMFVRIEKSIGNKYAQETFNFNPETLELVYSFLTSQRTHDFKKTLGHQTYLTSPAFCTAAIFTQSREIPENQKAAIQLISTENEWSYTTPPDEKIIFVEFKNRELNNFQLNGNVLPAAQLCLYQYDSNLKLAEAPVEIILSKHYGIPYQLKYGDQKIIIKNLKKNNLQTLK